MVFDGDCNFCRRWIARWRDETGDAIDYIPYQQPTIAEQFPEIPRPQFESAIQLIQNDGQVFSGAEAVCRSLAGHRRWPLWFYRRVPGADAAVERAYRFVAEHRALFSRVTTLFWGTEIQRPTFQLVRWIFLRALAVIYLIAFLSLWTQVTGLLGESGILPARPHIQSLVRAAQERGIGVGRYFLVPTLCWWGSGDQSLQWLCGAGTMLAALVLAGIAPGPSLFLLWLIYLSLTTVGRTFLSYQWDNLLLETGFLAIFFAPAGLWPKFSREAQPSRAMLWLFRWLLFRLMFSSGCVKLLSGDAAWHNLTALSYHYETQPLPTWLGWYAHQAPMGVHRASTVLMFVVELAAPFLIFCPRRLRLLAFWPFIGLECLIGLTGNYGFFNLLTCALCLLLLDDQALLKWLPKTCRNRLEQAIAGWKQRWSKDASGPGDRSGQHEIPATMESLTASDHPSETRAMEAQHGTSRVLSAGWMRWLPARQVGVGAIGVIVLGLSVVPMLAMFHFRPRPLFAIFEMAQPFRTVNSYGLFAVMTTSRPEIIVEGRNDGQTWLAYEFKDKAGDVLRRPRFVAPHQPRLDWQMWFAALGDLRRNPWFVQFLFRLLQGSPEVLSLLQTNPFPTAPPKYVRAMLYEYHFTDIATRRATGAWWKRELKGEYCPPISTNMFQVQSDMAR